MPGNSPLQVGSGEKRAIMDSCLVMDPWKKKWEGDDHEIILGKGRGATVIRKSNGANGTADTASEPSRPEGVPRIALLQRTACGGRKLGGSLSQCSDPVYVHSVRVR